MEITYCPNCGHQNEPGARFCEQCGCDLMSAGAAGSTDAGTTSRTGAATSSAGAARTAHSTSTAGCTAGAAKYEYVSAADGGR